MEFKNVRHFLVYVILATVKNMKPLQPLMSDKCYT